MFRFLVTEKENNAFKLNQQTLKHIKVSRISNEHFICIFQEQFYECKLENNMAKIIKPINKNHEFNNEIVLAISIIKLKNFELIIKKATELGATKLIPVLSHYTNIKFNQEIFLKKIARWNTIINNATEQSFRNKKMIITKPMKFIDVINLDIKNKYIAYVPHKYEDPGLFESPSLFLIGPEGGFTSIEIQKAQEKDFKIISLGKRILRAETATFFVLSRVKS